MPFQRLSRPWTIIKLGQDRKSDSWGPEKLLMGSGRESLAEEALGAPDELESREVTDKMR